MKRIISVLAVMAIMAALVAAMAAPAFADKGGGGHTTGTGVFEDGASCDPSVPGGCEGTLTQSNGGKGEFSGRETTFVNFDFSDPTDEVAIFETSTQGGGKGIKGGNCTDGFAFENGEFVPIDEGNGPRCATNGGF